MRSALERLQADFAEALIDPAAAAAVAGALQARDSQVLDRLALHRGNVAAAWHKALASAYPVVRALVGEEFFTALAHAYGRACPNADGDLNLFGVRLAAFVAAFEPARSLPYLADVAALEWAVHRAYFAADAQALPRARLAELSSPDLLGARFTLHPACAWFNARFPVATLWLAHQPQTDVPLPESLNLREFALVVRPRWRAQALVSSIGEIAALERLQNGADMDGAIEAARRAEPAFDFARALVRWLDLSVLTGMQLAEDGAADSSG